MNNHIIKGGHLSAQPMGALHDYIAIDPVTERHALVWPLTHRVSTSAQPMKAFISSTSSRSTSSMNSVP